MAIKNEKELMAIEKMFNTKIEKCKIYRATINNILDELEQMIPGDKLDKIRAAASRQSNICVDLGASAFKYLRMVQLGD